MPKFSHYQGMVYCAHDPRWACDLASGEGAKHKGGRFNPKGTKALYTSNTFEGAWDEAQLGFPKKKAGSGLVFCSRHSGASCFKLDVAVTLFSSYVCNEEIMQQIASRNKDVGLFVVYY
jgi:RES domain-containing protein